MRSQTVRAVIYLETDAGEAPLEVEGFYTAAARDSSNGPGNPEAIGDVWPVDPKLQFAGPEEHALAIDALWAEVRRIQAAETDPDVAEWERVAKLANDARRAGR